MADLGTTELELDGSGARLRRAREAAGLSVSDVSAQTKIPERLIAAIEDGNFAALPARAYAVGFSRSIARLVGLDEKEITKTVRAEIDGVSGEDSTATPTFEPGDPARVPSSGLAWLAGLLALAVVIAVALYWRSYYAPAQTLPSLAPAETPAAPGLPAAASAPTTVPAPAANDAVVFTATAPGVWVKFYDANGVQMLQKQLAVGESYTVPQAAPGPMIWTARPEALSITIGGQPVPPLADRQVTLKDVPVDAAALLARGAAPAPVAPAPRAQPNRPRALTAAPAAPAPTPPSADAPTPSSQQPSTVSD